MKKKPPAGQKELRAGETPAPANVALGLGAALLANALIIGIWVGMVLLRDADSDLFYRAVQEDEALEWATFWAFAVAGGLFAVAARRQWRQRGGLPWFFAGVGLFCLFVAFEEISWGQRLLGYRPPAYFLEHNFQQELNIHNVWSTDLRKFGLKAVIAGYGVFLPIAWLIPAAREWLERLRVESPSPWLVPSFALTWWAYESYPWSFTGEVVELMLGLGFCFAAIQGARLLAGGGGALARLAPAARLAVAWGLVAVLGFATAGLSRVQRSGSPEAVAAAEVELAALQADFESLARSQRRRTASKCGVHKRLYSWVVKYEPDGLDGGEFHDLVAQGLPEERAEYFIDPWNTPYWVRHKCSKSRGREVLFIYSFGPDRRRASNDWEIRGDDIGVVLVDRDR